MKYLITRNGSVIMINNLIGITANEIAVARFSTDTIIFYQHGRELIRLYWTDIISIDGSAADATLDLVLDQIITLINTAIGVTNATSNYATIQVTVVGDSNTKLFTQTISNTNNYTKVVGCSCVTDNEGLHEYPMIYFSSVSGTSLELGVIGLGATEISGTYTFNILLSL